MCRCLWLCGRFRNVFGCALPRAYARSGSAARWLYRCLPVVPARRALRAARSSTARHFTPCFITYYQHCCHTPAPLPATAAHATVRAQHTTRRWRRCISRARSTYTFHAVCRAARAPAFLLPSAGCTAPTARHAPFRTATPLPTTCIIPPPVLPDCRYLRTRRVCIAYMRFTLRRARAVAGRTTGFCMPLPHRAHSGLYFLLPAPRFYLHTSRATFLTALPSAALCLPFLWITRRHTARCGRVHCTRFLLACTYTVPPLPLPAYTRLTFCDPHVAFAPQHTPWRLRFFARGPAPAAFPRLLPTHAHLVLASRHRLACCALPGSPTFTGYRWPATHRAHRFTLPPCRCRWFCCRLPAAPPATPVRSMRFNARYR